MTTRVQVAGLGGFAGMGFTLEHCGCEVVLLLHGVMCSIRETDKRVSIRINPKLVKSQAKLDLVMHTCRESLGGID